MVARVLLAACLCCSLALAGCGEMEAGASARPGAHAGVFNTAGYAEAKAEADASDRLLLVDATATWCGPCKIMDKTTWVDDRVIEWVKHHAVAVQVDVDKHRSKARELRIQAMPTIIVFDGDRELDRVVGYRTADQLLEWLGALQATARAG